MIMGKDVKDFHNTCSAYAVHILYNPGPKLCILDWLCCHNHKENKNTEIQGLSINVNPINTAVDLLLCTSIQDIQEATAQDA